MQGPLRMWPGSHLEHLEHEQGPNGLKVPAGAVEQDGGQVLLAPAGSFIIFSVTTM